MFTNKDIFHRPDTLHIKDHINHIHCITCGAEELHDISETVCVIPNANVWLVSTSVQTHNKNFLFTKNATKPNACWDIVELTAFLQDGRARK
jgi:hypothetical protein